MIAAEPSYDGADPVLLAAIAVVTHALCRRDEVMVPDWVLSYRCDHDVELFGWDLDSDTGRWIRECSLPVSVLIVGGAAIALQWG